MESVPDDRTGAGRFGVPLDKVLDEFREAVAKSAGTALREARERSDVRTGRRPAFGIDGLDVELAVGVDVRVEDGDGDNEVLLDFRPPADAPSHIRFRIQPLPVATLQEPYLYVRSVYDPAGTYARHEYEAEIRDEDDRPVSFANMTVRITRADRERGQIHEFDISADRSGSARFVVYTREGHVELEDGRTEPLPAKRARSWEIRVSCSDPVTESEPVIVNAPGRSGSGR
ncbi:MAG: hypothetical protein QNJ12_16180 [Ilumatobacter sp.]|uniref:hypothetical protein n=1 Tax=Ilumatobacter sp. TaxID=1967498 RepID=UPI0026295482|nr:hypothetical protein [Ilumatobacter sp.]MDJ0770337.1 hypothetical protein [Ilumatobacter sp.]